MKKYCIVFVITVALLSVSFAANASEHPAVKILELYGQAGDGPQYVNPYIATIFCINSIHNGMHRTEVLNFIHWYFSKLNYPDMNGLTGTIYDYIVDGEMETVLEQYDSIDGYMGAFLFLLHDYVKLTGDTSLIRMYRGYIDDMVYLIAYLQDSNDGLTIAIPNTREKFAMNNCESYAGAHAYNSMLAMLGERSDYHQELEQTLKYFVVNNFYDKRRKNFYWAVSLSEKWPSSWRIMYPDAYAQVLFIAYGLLDDKVTLKRQIWTTFQANWGNRINQFPIEQQMMIRLARDKMK